MTEYATWIGTVTAENGLYLRTEPGGEIVRTLPHGARVTVVGEAEDWFAVTVDAMISGYAHSNYIANMAAANDFDRAIAFVLKWEGGLADDKNDVGGLTHWGISQRAYPDLDIRNLTREQAIALYRRDYWQASGADALPWPLSLAHLDAAVNTGIGQAGKFLAAANGSVAVYLGLRLEFYTKISGWKHYGAAWTRRVADLLREAA